MPNIKITVKNKIATNPESTEYICGNSDFVIDFDFDAEWDAYETKTARFIYGGGYQDIIFQGSQCAVPVISNTNTILCGVYAGDLHTTTPALIRARKGILCGNSAPADPAPDVYAQMMEILNKLSSDNPVDAVRYIPQELTEEQQKQARENISAPRAVTAKYWNNGGVDDARMLYSMAISGKAKGPFLCYAEDEGFNQWKYKPPLQMYDFYSDTMAWGFTVRSADGGRYEAWLAGESEGFVLGDRIEEGVTTVNGKDGEVKTLSEVKITKNADGTYSSDTKVWEIRNAVVAGFMCYATLDQERAMLSSFIDKYDAGTGKYYKTAVFDLLPVISENAITQRKIVIDDVAKTVTVTETELPTTSAVEALKTEVQTDIGTLKTDIGNNFLSYAEDQSLTQNEDGNTDWTVTAKETVPSGEEHWLTQTTEITEPVSAIKIPLPSPDIRKAVMRVALFSETEGTKISVRIYADRETSSGAENMLAAIGNYYTNAQNIREAYVSWSACGQKALNIYQTTASSANYGGAAAMYYIDRPQEYLYLVDMTPDTTFTGTITLDYCV